MGSPERPVEIEDVCETKESTEANVENKDVDVVDGVDEVGVSGYKSEGFTLSEILRGKRSEKQSVSEGVVDTTHLPQCEFSKFQQITLSFLREILCWPVIDFC